MRSPGRTGLEQIGHDGMGPTIDSGIEARAGLARVHEAPVIVYQRTGYAMTEGNRRSDRPVA